jgi:hypothetical protein
VGYWLSCKRQFVQLRNGVDTFRFQAPAPSVNCAPEELRWRAAQQPVALMRARAALRAAAGRVCCPRGSWADLLEPSLARGNQLMEAGPTDPRSAAARTCRNVNTTTE